MSAATDTAALWFYSYGGRFSIFISIWLPMEVIDNLRRKIKQCCDNWPLSTLSGFQVCKTNVASGSQGKLPIDMALRGMGSLGECLDFQDVSCCAKKA